MLDFVWLGAGLAEGWPGSVCPSSCPSGSSSAVERQLPKLDVAGSIPVSRSIISGKIVEPDVTRLTLFGLFAVTAMLLCYAFEARSRWFILAFAGACALGSIYGFLQGAWPFGLVEAVWSVVAIRRWAVAARSK